MTNRTDEKHELLSLVVYLGVMWALTHPSEAEEFRTRLLDRARSLRDAVVFKFGVWDTLAEIHSLPQVDP